VARTFVFSLQHLALHSSLFVIYSNKTFYVVLRACEH
jgi:hypothetical protein